MTIENDSFAQGWLLLTIGIEVIHSWKLQVQFVMYSVFVLKQTKRWSISCAYKAMSLHTQFLSGPDYSLLRYKQISWWPGPP
jgi:hypothetical protein